VQRKALEYLIGGKGAFQASAPTRRAFSAVGAGAAAWAVYLEPEHLDAYELKLGTASLSFAAGQLALDVSLVLADADQAKRAAAEWVTQRDQLASGGGGVPPFIGALAKSVQIVAVDDVVHLTASVAEKDFGSFFSML
jgi:hypothetical protein